MYYLHFRAYAFEQWILNAITTPVNLCDARYYREREQSAGLGEKIYLCQSRTYTGDNFATDNDMPHDSLSGFYFLAYHRLAAPASDVSHFQAFPQFSGARDSFQ